jgi:hypothetical protein
MPVAVVLNFRDMPASLRQVRVDVVGAHCELAWMDRKPTPITIDASMLNCYGLGVRTARAVHPRPMPASICAEKHSNSARLHHRQPPHRRLSPDDKLHRRRSCTTFCIFRSSSRSARRWSRRSGSTRSS